MAEEKKKVVTVIEPVGEPLTVHIVPLEGTGDGFAREKDVTFQFCHKVRQEEGVEDVVAGHTFVVSAVRIVEGMEDPIEKAHAKPEKAFEMLLKLMNMKASSFEAIDFGAEYFKQKARKPQKPLFDLASEVVIDGKVMTLGDARGLVERDLAEIKEGGIATQDHYFEASEALHAVFLALGSDHKVLKAWASDGKTNMPMLAALGKGENALREFLRFAEMSKRERAALFVSTTNGKVVDRQRMEGLRIVVQSAAERYAAERDNNLDLALPISNEKDKPVFTAESAREFLRYVALEPTTYDIADAFDLTEAELCAKVNERATEKLNQFVLNEGRHASAYDDKMAQWQRKTLGMVHAAFDGSNELDESSLTASHAFRKSHNWLDKLDAEAEGGQDKIVATMLNNMRDAKLQPLLAFGAAAVEAACLESKAKKERKQLKQNVLADEGEKEGIKRARTTLAKMDFSEAVAAVAKYASAHQDAVKVLREAATLLSSIEADKAQEAKAETEAA